METSTIIYYRDKYDPIFKKEGLQVVLGLLEKEKNRYRKIFEEAFEGTKQKEKAEQDIYDMFFLQGVYTGLDEQ